MPEETKRNDALQSSSRCTASCKLQTCTNMESDEDMLTIEADNDCGDDHYDDEDE